MDISDYENLEGDELLEAIRRLPRAALDEQIQQFGGRYANLCQRLEAAFTPDRLEQFIAIRPGGLKEIDEAIQQAQTGKRSKELELLKSFREINRVLVHFMDVYEQHVLNDLKYMSREELEELQKNIDGQLSSASQTLKKNAGDYRTEQNAAGSLRLLTLMQDTIQAELKNR